MAERSEAEENQVERKASASYPLKSANAIGEHMQPGYRHTEEGVIPEDWKTKRFGEVLERKNLKSYQIHTIDYRKSGNYPVVDQGQELIIGFTDREDKVFNCPTEGVIVFGDHTCIVKFVNFDFAVGADGTQVLESRDGQCTRFYAYHLELRGIQSTGYNRHFKFLKEKIFAIPGEGEQRTIATALSDADALIESLDRLIAKKRAIKQATMQQLLTGQTRLPGFTGEWECTTFSTVVRHHSGNSSLIKGRLSPSPQSDFHPGFSASGQDVWCYGYEHEGNAIVVSAVGSRCGKAFIASGKWNAIANTHVVWPVTNKIELRFLSLFLDREDFWLKGGSGQPFVMFKQTFSRQLFLPSIKEQTAIAKVLSDMDTEIEALERRSDKARQIKQGMMKQLLTGRVRLVEAKGEAGE